MAPAPGQQAKPSAVSWVTCMMAMGFVAPAIGRTSPVLEPALARVKAAQGMDGQTDKCPSPAQKEMGSTSQCFKHNLHTSSESPRTARQTAVWSSKQGMAAWYVPAKPSHSARIQHPQLQPSSSPAKSLQLFLWIQGLEVLAGTDAVMHRDQYKGSARCCWL